MVRIGRIYVTKQQLAVTGVIVFLAIAVVIVVQFASQRGEQVRREEAIAIAEEKLKQDADTPVVASDEKVTTRPTPSGRPSELPATGNELTTLLAVTGLSLALAFYVQSRRLLHQL